MFKWLISYFWGDSDHETVADDELQAAFAILNEEVMKISANIGKKDDEIAEYTCINKTGIITNRMNFMYEIDKKYNFKLEEYEFEIDDKVSYTIYKEGEDIKVTNVKKLNEFDNWEEEIVSNQSGWCLRKIVEQVERRDGRVMETKPSALKINLNTTPCNFIPIEGDWIECDIKCAIDETINDLSGTILDVIEVRPLRSRILEGSIKQFNENTYKGVINKNIFFNREALLDGYIPRNSDKIVAEIIESTQDLYNWRALKILHQNDYNKNRNVSFKETPKTLNYVRHIDGVSITDNLSVTLSNFNEPTTFSISISNSNEETLTLNDIKFESNLSQVSVLKESLKFPLIIETQQIVDVKFSCSSKAAGSSKEEIIFLFDHFNIGRTILINLSLSKQYNTTSRFRKTNIVGREIHGSKETVKGELAKATPRFYGNRLPQYHVTKDLYDVIVNHSHDRINVQNMLIELRPCLLETLSMRNYESRFHTLLFIEEIDQVIGMRHYDMDLACFIKNGEYLMLEIENLAEKRPTIIMGDTIVATHPLQNYTSYEGSVHRVSGTHLYLKFTHLFHERYQGEDYAIRAQLSRMPMRKLHNAVKLAARNLGKEILFPSYIVRKKCQVKFTYDRYSDDFTTAKKCIKSPSNKEILARVRSLRSNESGGDVKLEWVDKNLNYYQKEAVRNILLGESRPLPYIIFGPPGTGKTITVIETILQILRMLPHSRVLVATPSNSAADLVALRLIDSGCLKPGDLIRFVSHRIATADSIPLKLIPYSATGSIAREGTVEEENMVLGNGLRVSCTSSVIGRHRVTVGTCASFGCFHMMQFKAGHFTHVIVDEAGQCTEPDIMIPLSLVDVHDGQIILAGDPMQLGPIIQSTDAREFGLNESYMERLIYRSIYQRDLRGFPDTSGYNPTLITRLVYNYRALPSLIELPNNMFYHSDLKATINPDSSPEANFLKNLYEILPKSDEIPSFVFHGVDGSNCQTEDSPSWFNPDEASQVFYYINQLYRLNVKSTDIGIISPYVKQVKLIRELLNEAEFELPKIGTVEEFQGQEFNIVILSTVRSAANWIDSDVRHSLGFIASPRRLNVAITRAKCLNIIVGNPMLLSNDIFWRNVISYCYNRGTYIGCDLDLINV